MLSSVFCTFLAWKGCPKYMYRQGALQGPQDILTLRGKLVLGVKQAAVSNQTFKRDLDYAIHGHKLNWGKKKVRLVKSPVRGEKHSLFFSSP